MKSLKVNVLLDSLNRVLSYIFPLITFPYIARVFSPEGIGLFQFSSTVVTYFAMFAGLGIYTYAIREAASIRNDIYKLRSFCKEIFIINLSSTIISFILFFICIFAVPRLYENRILLCICSISILFNLISFEWFLAAKEEFAYITVRSLACKILSIIFLFLLVHSKSDLYIYAAINVVAGGAGSLFNFSFFLRSIKVKEPLPSENSSPGSPLQLGRHIKPIMVIFATIIANSLYTMLDTVMLGFIQNDQAVGLYAAASKINRILVAMVSGVGGILLPRLSYYRKNNMPGEYQGLLKNSFAFSLLFSIPTVIGLELLAPEVISVFCGAEFSESLTAMMILNPIIVIIAIGNFLNVQIFLPEGKEIYCLYIQIVSGILNFCMNLLLIPRYSFAGAAVGSICSELVVTVISIILAKKYFSVFAFTKSLIRYLFNALIMGALLFVLKPALDLALLRLLLCIFAGGALYVILLFIEKDAYFMEFLCSLRRKQKKAEVS